MTATTPVAPTTETDAVDTVDAADAPANPDASTATTAETATAVPATPAVDSVAANPPEQTSAQVDKEPADTPTMVMPAVVQPTSPQPSLESENKKPESGTQVPELESKTSGADDDPKLKPEPEPTVEAETKTEVEKSGNDETNDEPEKAAHGGGSGTAAGSGNELPAEPHQQATRPTEAELADQDRSKLAFLESEYLMMEIPPLGLDSTTGIDFLDDNDDYSDPVFAAVKKDLERKEREQAAAAAAAAAMAAASDPSSSGDNVADNMDNPAPTDTNSKPQQQPAAAKKVPLPDYPTVEMHFPADPGNNQLDETAEVQIVMPPYDSAPRRNPSPRNLPDRQQPPQAPPQANNQSDARSNGHRGLWKRLFRRH